jgi:dihydroxy-acid dehydratase
MTHEESEEIIRKACPGPGGCGIAASFNTWGLAMEGIGLDASGEQFYPSRRSESKKAECRKSARRLRIC